jgi:3-oxoadipate enol-lactonase
MAHIRIGDEHFNVAVDGPREAPVLMLSNSLGSDLRMWDPQMPDLTKVFRVIRYDSRGHGASPADEGPYTIEKLGRDALAILDKLGVDKAHWLGLSKGGMVGQWLLANAPGRIARAVIANTSAYMGAAADIWNARATAAREQGMLSLVDGTLQRWFTAEFRAKNPEIMEKIGDMIARTPAHGYAACCLAIRDMDQRQSIRSIRKPVLVIVGAHDPAATPGDGRLIAASIPGARVLELDAAHMSNVEKAEDFTKAVIAFLTGKPVGEAVEGKAEAAESPAPAPAKPPRPKSVRLVRVEPTVAPPAPAPVVTPTEPKPAAATKKPAVAAVKATKKPAAKKKASAKTSAVKKPAAKKASAKKAAGKAAPKKSATKKGAAKKSPAKKAAVKKAAKKAFAKKAAPKKPAKKTTARTAARKKSPAKKAPAKKTARKGKARR